MKQVLISIQPAEKSGNGKPRYTIATDLHPNLNISYSKAELFLLIAKEVDELDAEAS